MMTYVHSKSRQDRPQRPTEYFVEFDALRNEIRKVEIYQDGRFGYATQGKNTPGTELGLLPAPLFSEILKIPNLESWQITAAEFDAIWKKALQGK